MCISYTKVNVYFVRKFKSDIPIPKTPTKKPQPPFSDWDNKNPHQKLFV